jgi:hypothetical protein
MNVKILKQVLEYWIFEQIIVSIQMWEINLRKLKVGEISGSHVGKYVCHVVS